MTPRPPGLDDARTTETDRPPRNCSVARPAVAPGTDRGFTLIEVVVAVAVVALGLAAAFGGISQMAANTSLLQEKTLASWIAQNRITELRLQPQTPPIGESDGEVEFANQNWFWEAEVIATQVEALRRVEVRVSYESGERTLATAVGFVGQPPPAGSRPSPWATPGGAGNSGIPGLDPGSAEDLLNQGNTQPQLRGPDS
jgi:general secretion pathway protein I